jgi:flagellar protein FlbT
MYIDSADAAVHHRNYWNLVHPLVEAVPSVVPLVDRISDHILNGRYYQALKQAMKLIEYEEEVMNRV